VFDVFKVGLLIVQELNKVQKFTIITIDNRGVNGQSRGFRDARSRVAKRKRRRGRETRRLTVEKNRPSAGRRCGVEVWLSARKQCDQPFYSVDDEERSCGVGSPQYHYYLI